RDQLISRGAHRGVDGIACAQCLAAPLTCAMPGVERVGSVHVGLYRALMLSEQTVTDREGPGLIELDGLHVHDEAVFRRFSRSARQRSLRGGGWLPRWARAGGFSLRARARAERCRH